MTQFLRRHAVRIVTAVVLLAAAYGAMLVGVPNFRQPIAPTRSTPQSQVRPMVEPESERPAEQAPLSGVNPSESDGHVEADSNWEKLSADVADEMKSGLEHPLVKKLLDPSARIEGIWHGFNLPGFDHCTLRIKKYPSPADSHVLSFVQIADYGFFNAHSTGFLKDGVIVLESPVTCFGYSVSPCRVLFVVSANHHTFVIPSTSVGEFTDVGQLESRFAYEGPHSDDSALESRQEGSRNNDFAGILFPTQLHEWRIEYVRRRRGDQDLRVSLTSQGTMCVDPMSPKPNYRISQMPNEEVSTVFKATTELLNLFRVIESSDAESSDEWLVGIEAGATRIQVQMRPIDVEALGIATAMNRSIDAFGKNGVEGFDRFDSPFQEQLPKNVPDDERNSRFIRTVRLPSDPTKWSCSILNRENSTSLTIGRDGVRLMTANEKIEFPVTPKDIRIQQYVTRRILNSYGMENSTGESRRKSFQLRFTGNTSITIWCHREMIASIFYPFSRPSDEGIDLLMEMDAYSQSLNERLKATRRTLRFVAPWSK